MEKKFKVYAPVDCEIFPIDKLNDGVFSEKLLGDGVYIKPLNGEFYSPIDNGNLKLIFETKHAYYFEIENGPTVLMHIGLETVKLNGKPFRVATKQGSKVNLDHKIVEVDFSQIKSNNEASTETPIVMDTNDNPGWSFVSTNVSQAKRGEVIGELIFNEIEKVVEDQKPLSVDEAIKNGVDFRDSYQKACSEIYAAVGMESNYDSYYHCVTRFRFRLKNKNIVDLERLKAIPIVKGLNFADNELQIIIGAEVQKVVGYYDRFIEEKKSGSRDKPKVKKPVYIATLDMFKAFILPALPALIGASLLIAISSILQITKAIPTLSIASDLGYEIDKWVAAGGTQFEAVVAIIFLVSGMGAMGFLGIFFCYNGVKYFKGNPSYGILLGLIIASPILIRGLTSQMEVGGVVVSQSLSQWNLVWAEMSEWTDGWIVIKIAPFTASLFVAIPSAWALVNIDKIVTKHMPKLFLNIFGPPLVLFITTLTVYFGIGPVIGMFENILGQFIGLLSEIPFGISVMIYAATWQIIVLTGAHVSLTMILMLPFFLDPAGAALGNIAIPIIAGKAAAIFGQLGAGIGIALTTKNQNTKDSVYGSIIPAVFGITEPLIYGVTLPKGKPFLLGCLGAGIGGWIIGIFEVPYFMAGGGGILSILNITSGNPDSGIAATGLQISMYVVGALVALGAGCLLTVFFAKDRAVEKTVIKNTNKQIEKVLTLINNGTLSPKLKSEMDQLALNYSSDEFKAMIKKWEKYFSTKQKSDIKISLLTQKEGDRKASIANKINKLKAQNKLSGIANLVVKFNNNKTLEKINLLKQKIADNEAINNTAELELFINQNKQLVQNIIENLVDETHIDRFEELKSNYMNAVNSLFINYELEAKSINTFNKKEVIKAVKGV